MGDRSSMKEIFLQCQTGLQGHGRLMKSLNKIYEKVDFDSFWTEFKHYLQYAMIVFKREPAVERMVDFVAKFVPSLSKKVNEKETKAEASDDDEGEDSVADNRLLQEMFDFLLKSHSARDRGVRFRCCQLINKLLTNLGEDAQIDDELYDRLYECMLERLKDKCPMVRYHAVMAMARLQDPTDENCPVIKAYLFLLNCDPNPDVRRAVLSSIAPSTRTLASIVGRTRDVKDTVRKTAYEVLAEKIHIKALSIALRLQLVSDGLNDRAEMVQQACSGKLLMAWMRTFQGNILDLLKSLDVEDSTDICSRVLETLFKASSLTDMIEQFSILDEQLLVPMENLTCESVLYWQVVCKYIHAMGTDGDEYMEKVMPTVVDFCAYMQKYVEDLKTVMDPEIQLSHEFIIEQLLLITGFMDTADAASKRALETLLHNMLIVDHVSHRLVKSVVARICALRGTGENMVPYFAETVSEIREPITIVEKDIETEKKRQINLKIAGIRVQLNQLKEDLDTAVKNQNFSQAAEIKEMISQLDHEKNLLLETSEPVREEVRTEKNDPLTILKCQSIMSEMLQVLKLSSVSPTLQMMIESQIVPGIQNEDAEVRNVAMQALGLCCYLSKDLLVTYIPLFMQASQIDVEGVRVTALQILFDLLLIYGLEIVDASEGSSSDTSDGPGEGLDSTTVMSETASRNSDTRGGTASKLVAIICSFLDGESSELRTCAAEGLSKLLLSGRVVSSKILSHLILLWYNPLSEDDTHLRDCLGTFFPLYGLASRSNQEVVEEAFLPTLRTLLNAPATSPLAEVDVNNVAELLVQLTNTKLLTANQNNPELSLDNPGHDNLAETVCNEILSKPESSHVKLWSRILNQMEVSPDNEVVLKDLRILAYKMVMTVTEKLSLKALQKFQSRINELAEKFVTENDDLTNMEIAPVAPAANETLEETLDTTAQTPKRKRVRGLYSQNLTLALESEEELDIVEDSTVDVDASCLMSRSSVDTPQHRGRKNTTTTELADDDVFPIPEVSEEKELGEASKAEVTEVAAIEEGEEVENRNMEKKTTDMPDHKLSGELSSRSNSCNRQTGTPGDSPSKSPRKSSEKRKASKSPENASPEKRFTSTSPARRSQEKRKASKSPARDRKRLSQSPSTKSPRGGSRSPEKRKASKSPVRQDGGKRKLSRSPVEEVSRPSKLPEKAGNKQSDIGKNASKPGSASIKPSGRSMSKTSSVMQRSDVKKTTGDTLKPPVTGVGKVGKALTKPKVQSGKDISSSSKTVKKTESPVKKTSENSGNKGPIKNANVRKTVPKTVESSGKEGEKSARNYLKKTLSPRLNAKPSASPSAGTGKGKITEEKSPRVVIRKIDEASKLGSPRNVRKAASMAVEDTPEQASRRVSTRSKLGVTPTTGSPRTRQRGTETSVAETPDLSGTPKLGKDPKSKGKVGSVVNTPNNTTNPKSIGSGKKASKRGSVTPSISSETESSPEKTLTRSSHSGKGKVLRSTDSAVSSPDVVKAESTRKLTSAKVGVTDELGPATDDDEEYLRRKAKPSRRSATTLASVSVVSTPPTSARSTRSSVVLRSGVSSPVTGTSPRQPVPVAQATPGTPGRKELGSKAPVRKSSRGMGDESSQDSTLSLLSTKSTVSSARSKGSATSGVSVASTRTAALRSKSASTVTKTVKSTASTGAAKSARPSSASRPDAGKLKRPLRSSKK